MTAYMEKLILEFLKINYSIWAKGVTLIIYIFLFLFLGRYRIFGNNSTNNNNQRSIEDLIEPQSPMLEEEKK